MNSNIQTHSLPHKSDTSKKPNHSIKSKGVQISKFKQALQKYESIVLSNMLEPIFENRDPDPLTGGGFAEKTLSSFLVQEYAKEIVKSNKLDIAKEIKKQLLNKYQHGGR